MLYEKCNYYLQVQNINYTYNYNLYPNLHLILDLTKKEKKFICVHGGEKVFAIFPFQPTCRPHTDTLFKINLHVSGTCRGGVRPPESQLIDGTIWTAKQNQISCQQIVLNSKSIQGFPSTMADSEPLSIDSIIARLLEGKIGK